MPKGETRHGRQAKSSTAPARPRAPTGDRRVPPPVEPPAQRLPRPEAQLREATPRPPRATAMRLAAEVERLERELAAARSQMAALEARADVDPLTDILNRRGFERELKRSLAYVKRYGTERRAALSRSRRLQGDQRPPRPCGRRRRAQGGGDGAQPPCARLRRGGAARRRRVRRAAVEHRRGGCAQEGAHASRRRSPAPPRPMPARRSRSAPRRAPRCCSRSTSPPT